MSTSTITPAPGAHLASVFLEKGNPPVIVAVSNYVPGVGELVVRVEACGVNPGDIMYPSVGFPSSLPMICGADVVGIVQKVGAGVQGFVVGDRVAGYSPLHWSMQKHIEDGPAFFINGDILKPDNKYGGFQEQTVMFARGCIKVPTLTIEQAATLGCGFSTAGEAFWNVLHYPRPSKQSTNHGTLLVWGGSGSIGAYAIQFAKLAGIRVITAASPRHREYLLSIGAENVFDYNDPKAVEEMKKEGVENVLDTVSKVETIQACLEVLQGSKWEGKKKIAITLFMKAVTKVPEGIEMHEIWVPNVFKEENTEFVSWLYGQFLASHLANGTLQPNRPKAVPGGLASVWEAIHMPQEKKVSGEKAVVCFD